MTLTFGCAPKGPAGPSTAGPEKRGPRVEAPRRNPRLHWSPLL